MRWLGPTLRDAVRTGTGIALTGAGSWLGRAFLAALVDENALPVPDRLRLFGSCARTIRLGGQNCTIERLADAAPLSNGPWPLLHFAFLGKERTADLPMREFIAANDAILADVLRIAAPAGSLRMAFSSSGAVYGANAELCGGDPANPYGWCKIVQERRLTDWCAARAVPLVIPRIFNIGGPFINKTGSYALAAFIDAARNHGVIRIAARRPTFRSYVHVNEMLALAADLAFAQLPGPPLVFDTAGRDVVEMRDLADAVRMTLDRPDVTIERPPLTDETPNRYVGDGALYHALLAARSRDVTSLRRIIADTAAFLNAPRETTAPHDAIA